MIAWHYTTGVHFKAIAECGMLVPATAGIVPPERPILWFSTNQDWEWSANKGLLDPHTGERRWATRKEMRETGCGLVRFGYDAAKLTPWPRIARRAAMPNRVQSGLESVALSRGARPGEWLGTLEPLAVCDLVVEVWDDEASSWVRVARDD